MNAISLNDLIDEIVFVRIQYIDTDKSTVLHENKFSGRVVKVSPENGITIQPIEGESGVTVLPPSTEACMRDEDDVIHISWKVYRLQEVRVDGEHEWWDWVYGTQC